MLNFWPCFLVSTRVVGVKVMIEDILVEQDPSTWEEKDRGFGASLNYEARPCFKNKAPPPQIRLCVCMHVNRDTLKTELIGSLGSWPMSLWGLPFSTAIALSPGITDASMLSTWVLGTQACEAGTLASKAISPVSRKTP